MPIRYLLTEVKSFLKRCGETGIDALIVPDIPFEEKEELAPFCKEYDVRFISMIAPRQKSASE